MRLLLDPVRTPARVCVCVCKMPVHRVRAQVTPRTRRRGAGAVTRVQRRGSGDVPRRRRLGSSVLARKGPSLGVGMHARSLGRANDGLGQLRAHARTTRQQRGQAIGWFAAPRWAKAWPRAPVYARTRGGQQARPWRAHGGGAGQAQWPPRRRHGMPAGRIGEDPSRASKGVALVVWPWLCARARASGLPEPRRGRALGTAALGQGSGGLRGERRHGSSAPAGVHTQGERAP